MVGASAASASPPRWQLVPGAEVGNGEVMWEAGRLWLFKGYMRSAPVKNRNLGAWRTAGLKLGSADWQYEGRLGDELVFAGSRDVDAPLYTIKLLPNGLLGQPTEIGGAPAPQSSAGSNVIKLPDRAVRLVGLPNPRNDLVPVPGACCDVNGDSVSYLALTGTRVRSHLGLDRRGRLWLVWTPFRVSPKGDVRIVELDPRTLAPRGKASTIPRFRGSDLRAVVCSVTCRLVVRGSSTTITWAPGEDSPTEIRVPGSDACSSCTEIAAARDDAGRLVVAYAQSRGELGFTIGLARGDVRGGRLRLVSSIRQPTTFGPGGDPAILTSPGGYGALGSDGFAAAAAYSGGAALKAYLRVAILPLRP